jgi:hypothetical protein
MRLNTAVISRNIAAPTYQPTARGGASTVPTMMINPTPSLNTAGKRDTGLSRRL